eukprot:10272173-Heterocapsa_arctica.AAC.1
MPTLASLLAMRWSPVTRSPKFLASDLLRLRLHGLATSLALTRAKHQGLLGRCVSRCLALSASFFRSHCPTFPSPPS